MSDILLKRKKPSRDTNAALEVDLFCEFVRRDVEACLPLLQVVHSNEGTAVGAFRLLWYSLKKVQNGMMAQVCKKQRNQCMIIVGDQINGHRLVLFNGTGVYGGMRAAVAAALGGLYEGEALHVISFRNDAENQAAEGKYKLKHNLSTSWATLCAQLV
jgi:hypothetical protein